MSRIIFNGAANDDGNKGSGIITISSSAVYAKVLSDIRDGKGPEGATASGLETLISQSETTVAAPGIRAQLVETTIITGASRTPITPSKLELATEIPANMSAAFSKALERGSVGALDILMAGGAAPAAKTEEKKPSGLILPGYTKR